MMCRGEMKSSLGVVEISIISSSPVKAAGHAPVSAPSAP